MRGEILYNNIVVLSKYLINKIDYNNIFTNLFINDYNEYNYIKFEYNLVKENDVLYYIFPYFFTIVVKFVSFVIIPLKKTKGRV